MFRNILHRTTSANKRRRIVRVSPDGILSSSTALCQAITGDSHPDPMWCNVTKFKLVCPNIQNYVQQHG